MFYLGIARGRLLPTRHMDVHHTALRDAVFAHPTLAELLNTLFATLDDEALSKRTS